jgi:hypothetical protein
MPLATLLSLLFGTPAPSSKLVISIDEAIQIDNIEDYLTQAFEDGVVDSLSNLVLNPIDQFKPLAAVYKNSTKTPFKSQLASLLKELNGLAGIETIDIAKLTPAGATGELIFKNGVLQSFTAST